VVIKTTDLGKMILGGDGMRKEFPGGYCKVLYRAFRLRVSWRSRSAPVFSTPVFLQLVVMAVFFGWGGMAEPVFWLCFHIDSTGIWIMIRFTRN
jgi:hypothetical protein